jgi:hypothetical protein
VEEKVDESKTVQLHLLQVRDTVCFTHKNGLVLKPSKPIRSLSLHLSPPSALSRGSPRSTHIHCCRGWCWFRRWSGA